MMPYWLKLKVLLMIKAICKIKDNRIAWRLLSRAALCNAKVDQHLIRLSSQQPGLEDKEWKENGLLCWSPPNQDQSHSRRLSFHWVLLLIFGGIKSSASERKERKIVTDSFLLAGGEAVTRQKLGCWALQLQDDHQNQHQCSCSFATPSQSKHSWGTLHGEGAFHRHVRGMAVQTDHWAIQSRSVSCILNGWWWWLLGHVHLLNLIKLYTCSLYISLYISIIKEMW